MSIEIDKTRFLHAGETKFYKALSIKSDYGHILIFTWGKHPSKGNGSSQVFHEKSGSGRDLVKVLSSKIRLKRSNGYMEKEMSSNFADTYEEFKTLVGRFVLSDFTPDMMNTVDPSFPTGNLTKKEVNGPRLDENGRLNKDELNRIAAEQAARVARGKRSVREEAEAASQTQYNDNPLFGSF